MLVLLFLYYVHYVCNCICIFNMLNLVAALWYTFTTQICMVNNLAIYHAKHSK